MRKEIIGDAELWLGDCIEILPTLERVDAIVTDPPYGLGFPYLSYSDTEANLRELIAKFVPLCVSKARLTAISCGITNLQRYPIADWTMAVCWNTTGSHGMFGFNQWMAILLYGKDTKDFERAGGIIKSDVIQINGGASVGFQRDDEKEHHPCPKPENVMRKLIRRLAIGPVLDPFMGSGTTGVSCAMLGKRFTGIEINERYFDIACRRIEQAYRQPRLFQEPQPKPKQESML